MPLYLAIATGGGFFLGCCGALLVDTLDNKISSVDNLEQLTGQAVFGALPFVKDGIEKDYVASIAAPQSPYAEAIRAVRTSILFWQSTTPPKVILVTSSLEHEGKSTFSANLATVLAQQGRKVLLVDADLRRGRQYKRFAVKQRPGLSEMLTGQIDSSTVSSPENIPNLSVLSSGTVPPNPSELLGSQAMQACVQVWQTQYDFVIFDGAPVLPVTDSVSLHALADATLLLVRSGVAEKAHVKRSYRMLARNNHLLGVVMNALQANDSSYYGYYGYKKYGYNYKENADA